MKRIIALLLKWKINTEQKMGMAPTKSKRVLYFSNNNLNLLNAKLLQDAEKCIVKMLQSKYFNEKLKLLKIKMKKILNSVAKSAASMEKE